MNAHDLPTNSTGFLVHLLSVFIVSKSYELGISQMIAFGSLTQCDILVASLFIIKLLNS